MRMNHAGYEVGSATHVGSVRTENQDAVGYFQTEDRAWTVLTVCDGMGGHAAGERASSLAVEVIGREFAARVRGGGDPRLALAEAIRAANAAVYQDAQAHPERKGMGTTAAVLAVRGDHAFIAHVGDSRVYRVRADGVERLTVDHSSVQRMVDAGVLTPEQAESHPDSNILSRCIGAKPEVEPDVCGPETVLPGDRFVLCSDGLHGLVKDEEIAAMVWAFRPQDAVGRLIGLANDRGGPDNISVQVLYRTGKHPPTGRFQPERFRRGGAATVTGSSRVAARVMAFARAHPFWVGFGSGVLAGAVAMRLFIGAPSPEASKPVEKGVPPSPETRVPPRIEAPGTIRIEPSAAGPSTGVETTRQRDQVRAGSGALAPRGPATSRPPDHGQESPGTAPKVPVAPSGPKPTPDP